MKGDFMKNIRVEKRIPFGFKGEWGKVYKPYITEAYNELEAVKWNETIYTDIGQDVQFKYQEGGLDKQTKQSQTVQNLVTKGDYRIVETTDAYWDVESGNFKCVVTVGDVLFLFGEWWTVDEINDNSIFTPAKQTFYFLSIKNIKEEIIRL